MTLAHDLLGVMHDETLICLKGYSQRIIPNMLTYIFMNTDIIFRQIIFAKILNTTTNNLPLTETQNWKIMNAF